MSIQPVPEAQMTLLLAKKVGVPKKYTDFLDVFSKKSTAVLSDCLNINKYAIDLERSNQPPYKPIYSLGPVELKTLKTYIKTNLINKFIRPSKSSARALIIFIWKFNGSLRLYVNYRNLNNLTIKNRYSVLLIGKLLDQLKKAKRFT